MSFSIETFPVYPLGCNCSILSCDSSGEAIVVDPGGDEERIASYLQAKNLRIKYIVHTHAHFDHCLGTKKVASQHENCQIGLHKEDLFLYENLAMQCGLFGVPFSGEEVQAIDLFLQDNQILEWGESGKLEILHTPGHTPGSVSFLLQNSKQQILLSGDTLFAGGIGRTDLWGGDSQKILKSIKGRLLTLDDSTAVIPGHGEATSIYQEKKGNPFLV